jgi:DNA-binding response OmpR family regulator
MKRKILIVEDDRKMADLVRLYLEKDGYRVQLAYDGAEGLELGRHGGQDLILLDVMLPYIDGLDVLRMLRQESKVPVIMLTARSTEDDKLIGLNMGADDYITKPFSPRELVARVRAVLRRTADEEMEQEVTHVGGIVVDFVRHEVRLRGAQVHLTPKEFRLLATLAREPGRAFSRLELLEKVFGYEYEGLERTLDVHVMNLRKKIEADPAQPRYVLTVYGLGYKLGDSFAEAHANVQ